MESYCYEAIILCTKKIQIFGLNREIVEKHKEKAFKRWFYMFELFLLESADVCMHAKWLESRLPGEISIISDMQMTPPLWQKVKKN